MASTGFVVAACASVTPGGGAPAALGGNSFVVRDVVASAFGVGADGVVGSEVEGVDPTRALEIDPLIWSSFLGGEAQAGRFTVAK